MYRVCFTDEIHGENWEDFESFDAAAEYWQSYADTPTCVEGELIDLDNGETIWSFGDAGGEVWNDKEGDK